MEQTKLFLANVELFGWLKEDYIIYSDNEDNAKHILSQIRPTDNEDITSQSIREITSLQEFIELTKKHNLVELQTSLYDEDDDEGNPDD